MTGIRQHRETPDLLTKIAELQRRIMALETGRRIGNTSLDGGELSIRNGDIVVRNIDNEPVTRLEHGDSPRIRFYPVGDNNLLGNILAWESGSDGVGIQMNVESPGNVQDGGKILLMDGTVYLSYQPADGTEIYLNLAPNSAYREHFYFRGRWIVNDQLNDEDAIVMGQSDIGAGFGAATINFPIAFDTAPLLMYTLFSAVGPVSHDLTTLSSSSFTVGWSGTTAKTIYWQAWRR